MDNCPPDIDKDKDIDIDNIYGQNEFDHNYVPKNELGQDGAKRKENGQDIDNDEISNIEMWEENFEKFYKAYPKKVKKQNVKKWFKKNNPSSELFSSIMSSLEQFRRSKDWLINNGQYIPYPSTWLNQKRWEDEYANPNIAESIENTYTSRAFSNYEQRDLGNIDTDSLYANKQYMS